MKYPHRVPKRDQNVNVRKPANTCFPGCHVSFSHCLSSPINAPRQRLTNSAFSSSAVTMNLILRVFELVEPLDIPQILADFPVFPVPFGKPTGPEFTFAL